MLAQGRVEETIDLFVSRIVDAALEKAIGVGATQEVEMVEVDAELQNTAGDDHQLAVEAVAVPDAPLNSDPQLYCAALMVCGD